MTIISKATVKDIIVLGADVREYVFIPEKHVHYEAGQYLQLSLKNVSASEIWPDSRPFSITSSSSNNNVISIIVKMNGDFTKELFENLKENDTCTIKYAFGVFHYPPFDSINHNQIVCIAGGIGVTPFLSFIEYFNNNNSMNVLKLFYSVKYEEDFIHLSKLQSKMLKENLFLFTTQEIKIDYYNKRIDKDDIINNISDLENTIFYVSGPSSFLSYYTTILEELNIDNYYIDEWK